MRILQIGLAAVVPVAIVVIAFLNASALTSLVEGTFGSGAPVALSVPPRPAPKTPSEKSADPILARNPFEHQTMTRAEEVAQSSICDGVRSVVLVGDENQDVALAALDYGGKRILRRRGGAVGDRKVVYVGRTTIWLEGPKGLCEAPLFGKKEPAPPPPGAPRTAAEEELAKHIVQTSEHEYSIDRPTLERMLDSAANLRRSPVVPEGGGVRLLSVQPGSPFALMGFAGGDHIDTINGFSIGKPEEALEAYARLRQADLLEVAGVRGGKPLTLRFTIAP